VTYSSPRGWGRDGGVVIIEHLMPDGSTAYSQYGHMMETATITFPVRYSCVHMGDVIGAIGDARPAPHLHLEIRDRNPDIPGAGYEWEDPRTLGYLEPSAFIIDWQAWLSAAALWHVEIADAFAAPPLVLNDNSLLALSGPFLRRILPDGRILWRETLTEPAVGVVGYQGAPLLIFADGTLQFVDYDGNFGEFWQLETAVDSAPIAFAEFYVLHTPDNALVAVGANWRDILWRTANVPPFVRAYVAGDTLALLTSDFQLLMFATNGEPLNSAQLRGMPGLGGDANGLLVYTRTGLWRAGTEWTLESELMPQNPAALAVVTYDGGRAQYDGMGLFTHVWRTEIPGVSGGVSLTAIENTLLLISTSGVVTAISTENGVICGSLRVWGAHDSALLWHALGDDGTLRIIVGNRLFGLAWEEFGCDA
jgi:hypothetical protein